MDTKLKKRLAAEHALTYVQPGMKLGLGTGSTSAEFIDLLGERVAAGLNVVAVATSKASEVQARACEIPIATLDDHSFLDLVVDGADELDAELRLIKGGGGALLREKIVAAASDRMIVIADDSKRVSRLGKFPLPIEVVEFGLKSTVAMIEALAHDIDLDGTVRARRTSQGELFRTDEGNLILDCGFGHIPSPEALADVLGLVPGIVEHGLFLGLADVAIIAGEHGLDVLEANVEEA
ncbi:MAG: ribose-5-phosphate isomerase RpiA [Hyphomicrobiaceae bacterium]